MKMQFIRRKILCCHMKEATYSFNARFTRFVLLPPLRYYSTCRNFWNNVHDSDGWKLSTRPLPFLVRMRNIKSAPIVSTNLKSCFPVPKGGGGWPGRESGGTAEGNVWEAMLVDHHFSCHKRSFIGEISRIFLCGLSGKQWNRWGCE